MPITPFKSDHGQQWFEFSYLVLVLIVCVISVIVVSCDYFSMLPEVKVMLFSAVGGVLGGWAFDAKWFYRVTARGKDNQYKLHWEEHKIFWRLLVPVISGVVAVAFYCLLSTGVISFLKFDGVSGRYSFAISFLLGYFSDATISKMGDLINTLFGDKPEKAEGKNDESKGG